jgi:hypothetical protein
VHFGASDSLSRWPYERLRPERGEQEIASLRRPQESGGGQAAEASAVVVQVQDMGGAGVS